VQDDGGEPMSKNNMKKIKMLLILSIIPVVLLGGCLAPACEHFVGDSTFDIKGTVTSVYRFEGNAFYRAYVKLTFKSGECFSFYDEDVSYGGIYGFRFGLFLFQELSVGAGLGAVTAF
jgi:hypothetical protein